ncbi:hypothetical protein CF15_03830 [Pyrodictium occultum]|uniref:Mechanosensitive ion channel MscS domain-containing protein n=1 Tax=Pyrodictium occultum TaxID=2309 RepID=A0A0V8RV60_PYROC|nr:mechanosensitive ion channel domain-containing protein [Pyrodictium occultum]KSW11932.1 hypothetical protein CF15_03830 [Pyrodictium occultum]
MATNTTAEAFSVNNVTNFLGKTVIIVRTKLIPPLIEVIIVFVIVYLFLRLVKSILSRLQRREILPSVLSERIYKLIALITYVTTAIIIVYMFTSAPAVIYTLVALLIVVFLSNWNIIADISAYYVMLISKQSFRGASLIELPRLGIKGKIIETSPLYTRIRTLSGKIVFIPNHIMVSEPVTQLTSIQSVVTLEVEVNKPEIERGSPIEYIEKAIRTILAESRLATRPQDVVITVLSASSDRIKLEVRIPTMGAEPRPATVNAIIDNLYRGLAELSPAIRFKPVI